jgi:dihydropteroate synthase
MTSSQPTSPTPARFWQLRTQTISFEEGPAVMGIVNVTPDSFSDGGKFFSVQLAIDHAMRLAESGANILDIGGESTRPYSDPVSTDEELRRVIPVIEALVSRVAIPISVDTSKARVAQAAIDAGAQIVNDITGLEGDSDMASVVAKAGVGVCAMHMQGSPQTMQDNPQYENVVADILGYLQKRDLALQSAGITPDRICLDPGIGFGKTTEHNHQLLQFAESFLTLRRPILIGHSRKGFIGKLIGDKQRSRDAGTLGISLALAKKGIQILRVHEVASTVDALICFKACFG